MHQAANVQFERTVREFARAGAACVLVRSPRAALALSVVLALALIWSALALSYLTGWPAGFFTGVLAAVLYVAARIWRTARRARHWPGLG